MPDFRGDIRRAIFTKVGNNSVDIMQDAILITNMLNECSKRYKDFNRLEKLNIELTVPIQLPPNGKRGDCNSVVLEVQKSFNELGGGSRIYHALGSWLDGENRVVSDHCVIIYTAIPISKWFECIPVLRRLIRDEIQSKLFQECVFLRIDNQTFGEPLNLLGNQTDEFPSIDEFGGIDPACMTMMGEYEEHPVHTVVKQEIKGDKNTQISSGGDSTSAIGEGAMAAKGDIHVHNHGIDPKEHAQLIAEKQMLEMKLAQINEENDEHRREQIAVEAMKLAEEMQNNKSIEFDARKLMEIGVAARLAGQLDRAEGYNKQALRKFKARKDRQGVAEALHNLGNISYARSDLVEAERLYQESLAIGKGIGDRQTEARSMTGLGNIAYTRSYFDEAERLHQETLAILRDIGDQLNEAKSLNNLGNIARIADVDEAERLFRESLTITKVSGDIRAKGVSLWGLGAVAYSRTDYEDAEQLFRESLAIFRDIGDRQYEAKTLNALGNIANVLGDYVEAERLFRETLAMMRDIGDRLSEAKSLNNLGLVAEKRADFDEAERMLRETLAIMKDIGDRLHEGMALNNLGRVARERGELDEAERLHRESLAILREIGNRAHEAKSLWLLGIVAEKRGEQDAANIFFREANEIRRELGFPDYEKE